VIRSVIVILPVAACLLAATLAWELDAFSVRRPADILHPRVQAIPLQAPEPDHTADWVSSILGRPLFSLGRRQVPTSSADAGGPAASQGLPRLTGVLVGPFGRNAIFAAEGRKPLVVSEGGKVDAWTVQSISVGGVRVSGPGGAITLQPSFESSPAATTGSSPAGQRVGLSPPR
jgi:hypothetical protein